MDDIRHANDRKKITYRQNRVGNTGIGLDSIISFIPSYSVTKTLWVALDSNC